MFIKHNFQKLKIWISAREITLYIYKLIRKFPISEQYGLKNQITRAAVSIQANIAEGSGYGSNKQFLRFLHMTMGSLCEVESHCYVAYDLEYINNEEINEILSKPDELKKKILSFTKTLN